MTKYPYFLVICNTWSCLFRFVPRQWTMYFLGGGGEGCVWRVKMQTCEGRGSGDMLPWENLRNLDCLGQNFARFHGGHGGKENVE